MRGRTLLLTAGDRRGAAALAVKLWADAARRALRRKRRFSVAVSGGRTPLEFFRALARSRPPGLAHTHIFQVDERFVPRGSPQSNYRALEAALLRPAGVPRANVHGISPEGTPKLSAARYEADLRRFFRPRRGCFPRFDLVLLGLGADGHTASLFPGAPALREKRRFAAAARQPGGLQRITLTLPVINCAREAVFLVTGSEKSAMVREVLGGGGKVPAALVRPHRGRLVFLLDRAAAREPLAA